MDTISGHYIVCGCGDTGRHVIDELKKTKTSFRAVDISQDCINSIESIGSGICEMRYLVGDATDPDVLAQLGVAHAKGLISTLPNAKDSLVLTVLARQKNPRMHIVVRSPDHRFAEKLLKAGATSTVSTQEIGGRRLASELLRPNVTGFLELMRADKERTLRVDEIHISKNSPWIGRSLQSIDLPSKYNLLLLALKDPHSRAQRRTFWVNPPEIVSVCQGLVLIVLGEVHDVERARRDSAVSLHPEYSVRHE